MTLVYPEGTPTLGNTSVKGVLTIASLAAPSLATEINAVSSLDLSAHLYPEGWTPSGTTARGTARARLASKTVVEVFNRTTYTLGDLQYVYDPQAADSDPGNEAKELLAEGTQLYLVERIGLDAEDDAWAATQHVLIHHVEVGPQIRSGDRTDENGEFFITQPIRYVRGTGPVEGIIAA